MGGNPVDETAYNQLLSNGYYIQGSPELAQYKERVEQDNRDSDRPPARDSAGRLVTRPSPKEASVSELAQLISESSKGGSSILGSIPSLTGIVQGKLATGYQDKITETLKTRLADPKISAANKAALKELQTIWTNADLSKKDRVKAVSKTQLYVPPSTKNMLGRKKGKFGTEDWFGYATDDDIENLFGASTTPKVATVIPTKSGGKYVPPTRPVFTSTESDNDNQPVDAGGLTQPEREEQNKQQDKETSAQGVVDRLESFDKGFGGLNKGGIIKKRKKKK
jgi:hypothetical protein